MSDSYAEMQHRLTEYLAAELDRQTWPVPEGGQ